MNGAPLKGGTPHPYFTQIKIANFDVSCVGPDPFRSGFGFGSDDGKLVFTDEVGMPFANMNGSRSGEAINGIASIGRSLAVSSRREVTVRTWTREHPDRLTVSVAPHGAHGISSTPGGYYVAPLGRTGIMVLRAESGPDDPVSVLTSEKESMYFYRVLARPGRNGREQLLCAARRGGIGITEIQWGQSTYNMRTATFPGLDAVDVCFVGGEAGSPAIAAVGRDGSLILARDMLHDRNHITIKFATVQGTAYRLLSSGGDLFLLTSQGLYGLMGLGERLLLGKLAERLPTSVLAMPMEAVDANMIGGRWLLVVMPDEVRRFDVKQIAKETQDQPHDGVMQAELPTTTEGKLEISEVSQSSRELVAMPG